MNALESLVGATLGDPLAAARAHAAVGGRVIGYVSCNVPIELILAAGAFPLHLPHTLAAETSLADRYMEPLFDRSIRSIFERWLAGDFGFVESIVLPRSLDSAQRAYYYAEELRRRGRLGGPPALLFDLQKVPRASSEAYSVRATVELAAALGAPRERLTDAIERINARRGALAAFDARRRSDSVPSGAFVAAVLRAALYAEPEAFDLALAAWLQEPPRPAAARTRILFAGSVPPDERLHEAIDAGGGLVTGETHMLGMDRHGPAIDARGDPLGAIGRAYHRHTPSVRDFTQRLEQGLGDPGLVPQGIVLWLCEEEEALVWQVPALTKHAAATGLPLLTLTRQDWLAGAGTLAAITQFVREIAS